MKKVNFNEKPPEGDCSRFNAIKLRGKKSQNISKTIKLQIKRAYINNWFITMFIDQKYFRSKQVSFHVFFKSGIISLDIFFNDVILNKIKSLVD